MPSVPLDKLFKGDPAAIARAISIVENREPGAEELLRAAAPRSGKAHRIGIAGPPGAGKSTLIGRLIDAFRAQGRTVGVVATDPSSPFTGGAILGDRLRIREPGEDHGVFYRSMAARGHRGGLARACRDSMRILEASGKEVLIVETVGIGQSELDIAATVDTVVLVLVPESGDFIQALKAGILEVGDLLVVNKADREGAEAVARELEALTELGDSRGSDWRPRVLKTVAREGTGIDALCAALADHWKHLQAGGRLKARRRDQGETEIRERLRERFLERMETRLSGKDLASGVQAIADGTQTPDSVADRLWDDIRTRNDRRSP